MNSVRNYMVAVCSLALVLGIHASQQPTGQQVKQQQNRIGEYRKSEPRQESPQENVTESSQENRETNEERRGVVGRAWDGAKDTAHSAWRSVKNVFGW